MRSNFEKHPVRATTPTSPQKRWIFGIGRPVQALTKRSGKALFWPLLTPIDVELLDIGEYFPRLFELSPSLDIETPRRRRERSSRR